MSDNIEQQDQIFFYNATNELINRTNNENRRINIPNYESSEFIMPIYELIDSRPITSSNNIIINNINNNMDTIRNYVNSLYDFPIPIMSSDSISNSIISTINESMNEKSRYKKVLSEEGEKSLTKVKYDKTKINYDKCPILQSEFEPDEEITQLPCKHCFNTSAIEHWLKEEKSICPVCRYELDNVEKKCNTDPRLTDENTDDNEHADNEHADNEDTEDEDTEDEDTDNMDIVEEEYNINNNYESSIFNLINSLERASNLNNRNYYNSITEDTEIQQAILMSFTN